MKPVIVKRFYLDDVFSQNKILFNTNNHYVEEGIEQPIDYREKNSQGNTKNWINKFHKDNYHTITLDNNDLKWMKEALQIGLFTGKFSHIYDDELEHICKKYEDQFLQFNDIDNKSKWFIRTDPVSLKEGMYGAGPYDNFKDVIKSMVTTKQGHHSFRAEDTSCTIYFLPWFNMDSDKEFRIFVYQNEITAISTQHLYTINKWLNSLTDEQIAEKVYKILDYFEKNIKDKMMYMANYTMDFALIGDKETPYFIEPNSFGKYYAAGSALYHWIYDHDTLHETDTIELRYVNEY